MVKCEACLEQKAEYDWHGFKTCRDCLVEHINDNEWDSAVECYIDDNANKL